MFPVKLTNGFPKYPVANQVTWKQLSGYLLEYILHG